MLPVNDEPIAFWLTDEGPDSDIILTTRIRLARNLTGHRFCPRAKPHELTAIREAVNRGVEAIRTDTSQPLFSTLSWRSMDELAEAERRCLIEQRVISREIATDSAGRGVWFDEAAGISVMVNEEDHVRAQTLAAGCQLDDVWRRAKLLDDALQQRLPFAYDDQLGFLTACPTNVGTGMRVSAMVHLPGLRLGGHLDKAIESIGQMRMAMRGAFGEGTAAIGDLYQISNQVTLGVTEEQILEKFRVAIAKVVEYERRVRGLMQKNERVDLENAVWRSVGALATARKIDTAEAMKHLSSLRLGVHAGLLRGLPPRLVNRLFVLTQPGHLQRLSRRELTESERDLARAQMVRDSLEDAGFGFGLRR
jgi:protein arginine kinase